MVKNPPDPTFTNSPGVAILSNGLGLNDELVDLVRLAGASTKQLVPLDGGIIENISWSTADVLVVAVSAINDELFPVLETINQHCIDNDVALIVILPGYFLEPAFAVFDTPKCDFMVDACPAEILLSLTRAIGASENLVSEQNEDAELDELHQLTSQVADIAQRLAALSGSGPPFNRAHDPVIAFRAESHGDTHFVLRPQEVPEITANCVRQTIKERQLRNKFFDVALFADPAWDILLDLYAARLEHQTVSVTSLCIAANVPPTTALRWIKQMTTRDLLEQRADDADGRRKFIALSDDAAEAMQGYFTAMLTLRG